MTLTGKFTAKKVPTVAIITLKVTATAKSVKRATDIHAIRNSAIKELLGRSTKLDPQNRIENEVYAVDPQYLYPEDRSPRKLVGYTASTVITFVLVDRTLVNAVLAVINEMDAVVAVVESVTFRLSDHDDFWARTEALADAGRDARDRADQVAEMMGFKVAEILKIEDQGVSGGTTGGTDYRQMRSAYALSDEAPPSSVNLSPGISKYTGTVNVTFLLEPFPHSTRAGRPKPRIKK